MTFFLRRFLAALSIGLFMPLAALAQAGAAKIGIVVMHGKGGAPTTFVAGLASGLESRGYLVANLEMPWSGRRQYDVSVSAAEGEVEAALKALREQGAQKLFVAGHSQGGLFALYFGGKHALDGIVAIAPGGDVSSRFYMDKVSASVALAHKLVDEGKGDEKTRLNDFEGSRGSFPVVSPPAAYLTWFDPQGAMNQPDVIRNMNPATPVLFVGPTGDYPFLVRTKQQTFDALPKNPRSTLYEPNSSHLEAPSASLDEVVKWTTAVAGGQ